MSPQIFIPTEELLIPTGINEADEKNKMQPVTVEGKISNCST